ncbi:MAG TPA: aminoglycoside phosphotransferase family protein [Mycobacteriales bacterium]|nr:aminoglycoside phosphotransferase family protein [Mycobacteriales bacterium]
MVTLPAAGDVAIRVAAGFKVFDLTAGQVTAVLPAAMEKASVLAIVEQLLRAATCPLAPAILAVDVPRRLYVEEYVDGRRLRGLDPRLQRLPAYLPLLAQVVSALPPGTAPLAAYAIRRAEEVRTRARRLAESVGGGRAGEARATIESFVDDVLARLTTYADLPVQLALSHGDLHGGNVCVTTVGPRIIDWGLSDVRTPSYDLYHRVFRTAWLRRQPTLPRSRILAALAAYARQLAGHPRLDLVGWRRAEDAYRLLFYLECLSPKSPAPPLADAAGRLRRHAQHVAAFRELERQRAAA